MALYLAAAVAGALIPGAVAPVPPGTPVTEVRLAAGPYHTDILLPATPARRAAYGFAADAGVPIAHPEATWIAVGWGGRDFYTTTGTIWDVRPAAAWRGATGDRAVLRVDAIGAIPDDLFPAIPLSEAQMAALDAEILSYLDGPALDHPGLTPTDAFFPARGRMTLLNTCNVWVGRTLRAAGVRVGAWTPLPLSLALSRRLR